VDGPGIEDPLSALTDILDYENITILNSLAIADKLRYCLLKRE
jgi:hypothetical protein